MFVSESEIYQIAFNRNITSGLIKPTQIKVSKDNWVDKFIGRTFMSIVEESPGDYNDLIEQYIKPIIAWGTLYNNFNYIMINLTDKGMVQLVSEGTASFMNRESMADAKNEIKNTIFGLLDLLDSYCQTNKDNENELFEKYEGLLLKTDSPIFVGGSAKTKIYY